MNLRKLVSSKYMIVKHTIYVILLKLPLGGKIAYRLRRVSWYLSRVVLPNPVLVNGCQLYWNPANFGYAVEFSLNKYEVDTSRLFLSLLHPSMVAVDIGANIGYYTLLFAKQVEKTGKVYAFEPQSINCDVLRKSVHANGYDSIVTIIPKAVSDKTGVVSFYQTEAGSGESSLYSRKRPDIKEQRITVDAVTLDEFFESEGWPSVHVIKMDVEGAEKAALEGMGQLVQRNPQLKLVMEFGSRVQSDAGVSAEELFSTLLKVGFNKFSVIQDGLQPAKIPDDIPHLVQMAGDGYVNLLCER